jgi:predicted TPR repeat methyltransferase
VADDITNYLQSNKESYDLTFAADVFVYLGDLQPLFEAIADRSASGACLLFSTELSEDQEYVLRSTGRFAHSERYIRKLAEQNGFEIARCKTGNLRKHRGGWIAGQYFLLTRR